MITLRDYQLMAHKAIEHNFALKKSPLLVMPTGTGKSITLISFIKKWEKDFIFIVIVKTRKLVDQLAKDSKKFNLDYGVFMASHDDYDETKEVLVCSIDTINSRGLPHITSPKRIILILDEGDQTSASSYQSVIKRYKAKPGTLMFGLTGTPWAELPHFDLAISPITLQDCKEKGILVDYDYYIPKRAINYDNIEMKRGEWVASQVDVKLNTPEMIAYSFECWQNYGDNRKTLVFCNSKEHALSMVNYINNYYQKEVAAFIYEKTSEQDRTKYFNEFANGNLIFLINIRIITRGVDLPIIGCILDLSPTTNINLHIQKLGRGSRQNGIWKNCIVIDMAKNVLNNGHFYQAREINIRSSIKRTKAEIEDSFSMRQCGHCFRAAEAKDFVNNQCPFCKKDNGRKPAKKKSKAQLEREKIEKMSPQEIENTKLLKEYRKELWKKQNLGLKLGYDKASFAAQLFILQKYGRDMFLRNAWRMKVTIDFKEKHAELLR